MLEQIKQLYYKDGGYRIYKCELQENHKEIYDFLESEKKKKNIIKAGYSEILYLLENNLTEIPRCKCGRKLYLTSFSEGYPKTCSRSCYDLEYQELKKIKDKLPQDRTEDEEKELKKLKPRGFQIKSIRDKAKSTVKQKYGEKGPLGDKNIIEKSKSTIQKKYGVSNVGLLDSTKSKRKETLLKLYGVDHSMKREEVKEKMKETIQTKYGVDNIMKLSEYSSKASEKIRNKTEDEKLQIKEKTQETCLSKYGVTSVNKVNEIREKMSESYKRTYFDKLLGLLSSVVIHNIDYKTYNEKGIYNTYEFECTTCHSKFKDYLSYNGLPRCLKCFPYNRSQAERDLQRFIESYNFGVETCVRSMIAPLELDIYIPEKNLAIEYNGLMFHSLGKSKHRMFNNSELESVMKGKHVKKTELCKNKEIQLLHIFENEWESSIKQDIWKSIISNKLGKISNKYYARKTIVREVSHSETKEFLTENHLQGYVSSSINLGLYTIDGELLQIMTFGKSRYNKNITYEMYRAASKKYTTTIGGSSKLFKHFVNNYLKIDESIITYADRRYSEGKIYEILGFQFQGISDPNYFYFRENRIQNLESRVKYQKHKLEGILESYDSNLTESENMYNNGYRKIYDSGNLSYLYSKR